MLPASWLWLRRTGWILMLVLLVVLLQQGWQRAQPHIDRPIGQVTVRGDLSAHNQQLLENLVAQFLYAGFIQVDIKALQLAIAELAWVEQVQVSRVWPASLLIEVNEHKPVAKWGDDALLNIQAKVFARQGMRNFSSLPQLSGPQDSQARVMEQYRRLSQILRPLGYTIAQLQMRERGSWFVTTQGGLELLLGREEVMEKMRRFVTIHEAELKHQMDQVARIDLRYSNGLAVTWRDALTQAGH